MTILDHTHPITHVQLARYILEHLRTSQLLRVVPSQAFILKQVGLDGGEMLEQGYFVR